MCDTFLKRLGTYKGRCCKNLFCILLVKIICKIHLNGTHTSILYSLFINIQNMSFPAGNVFSKCVVVRSGAEAEFWICVCSKWMHALSSVLLGNTRTNKTQHGGTELYQPSTGDCLSKLLEAKSNQQLHFKGWFFWIKDLKEFTGQFWTIFQGIWWPKLFWMLCVTIKSGLGYLWCHTFPFWLFDKALDRDATCKAFSQPKPAVLPHYLNLILKYQPTHWSVHLLQHGSGSPHKSDTLVCFIC